MAKRLQCISCALLKWPTEISHCFLWRSCLLGLTWQARGQEKMVWSWAWHQSAREPPVQEGHVQRWQGRHAALWGTSANTRQTRTLVTKDYSSKMLKRTIGSRFYAKKKKKKRIQKFWQQNVQATPWCYGKTPQHVAQVSTEVIWARTRWAFL